MSYLILLVVFVLVVFIFVYYSFVLVKRKINEYNYNYKPIKKTDATDEEKLFVALVNKHRVSLGLPILIHEVLTSEVCKERNMKEINANKRPSHYGWESMVSKSQVNVDNGDHICAEYYIDAKELFYGYLNSKKGHRRVIEKEDRTHIGTSYINKMNHTLIVKY